MGSLNMGEAGSSTAGNGPGMGAHEIVFSKKLHRRMGSVLRETHGPTYAASDFSCTRQRSEERFWPTSCEAWLPLMRRSNGSLRTFLLLVGPGRGDATSCVCSRSTRNDLGERENLREGKENMGYFTRAHLLPEADADGLVVESSCTDVASEAFYLMFRRGHVGLQDAGHEGQGRGLVPCGVLRGTLDCRRGTWHARD